MTEELSRSRRQFAHADSRFRGLQDVSGLVLA